MSSHCITRVVNCAEIDKRESQIRLHSSLRINNLIYSIFYVYLISQVHLTGASNFLHRNWSKKLKVQGKEFLISSCVQVSH